MATSNDVGAISKRTDMDEMDTSPTIKTHSEGSYCMHDIISTVWERGPYIVLHKFIYQFLSLLEKPIYIDIASPLCSHTSKQESATSFLVHGVDLHMDDISTLEQKVMMNDSIVKVLLE
jgi:hypothetical protein